MNHPATRECVSRITALQHRTPIVGSVFLVCFVCSPLLDDFIGFVHLVFILLASQTLAKGSTELFFTFHSRLLLFFISRLFILPLCLVGIPKARPRKLGSGTTGKETQLPVGIAGERILATTRPIPNGRRGNSLLFQSIHRVVAAVGRLYLNGGGGFLSMNKWGRGKPVRARFQSVRDMYTKRAVACGKRIPRIAPTPNGRTVDSQQYVQYPANCNEEDRERPPRWRAAWHDGGCSGAWSASWTTRGAFPAAANREATPRLECTAARATACRTWESSCERDGAGRRASW